MIAKYRAMMKELIYCSCRSVSYVLMMLQYFSVIASSSRA